MSRAVDEWQGATPDSWPPPPRVKARIVLRQEGKCACGCGVKFSAGDPPEFDHVLAIINEGENREGNIQALRRGCHRLKTTADVALKSVVARKRNKHLGLKPPSRNPLPGGRGSVMKHKIGVGWVRRDQD